MSTDVVDKAWCAWRALLLRHAAWRGRDVRKVAALENDEAIDALDHQESLNVQMAAKELRRQNCGFY